MGTGPRYVRARYVLHVYVCVCARSCVCAHVCVCVCVCVNFNLLAWLKYMYVYVQMCRWAFLPCRTLCPKSHPHTPHTTHIPIFPHSHSTSTPTFTSHSNWNLHNTSTYHRDTEQPRSLRFPGVRNRGGYWVCITLFPKHYVIRELLCELGARWRCDEM